MKRFFYFISIVFLIVLIPSFLAIPSKAFDFENDFCYNVLDYSPTSRMRAEPSVNIPFELAFDTMIVNDIDIIVYSLASVSSASVDFSYKTINCTVTNIGNNYYRLSCNAASSGVSDLSLNITLSFSQYVTVIKFNMYTASNYFIDTNASVDLSTPAGNFSFSYTPGSTNARQNVAYATDYLNSTFEMFIEFPKFKNFDFIDIQLLLHVNSVSSIGAYFGSTAVPISVSYLNNSSLTGNEYYINIRLDVRGLTGNDYPNLIITGQMVVTDIDFINTFAVLSCGGIIDVNNVNPLFYYVLMIKDYFGSQNTIISQAASDIVSAIGGAFSSTGVGETVKTEAESQANKVSSGVNSMGSLELPNSDSAGSSGNISSVIGSSDISAGTHVLTSVMSVPTFAKIITLALIFTLAAYVLFGKRG